MDVKEAYKNIEKIICYGFLYEKVSIKGFDIIIKSITNKEYDRLELLYSNDKDYELYSLAFCTAFINGINFISNRENRILELVNFYKKAPSFFVNLIIKAVSMLNSIYLESLDYLEGFCYSPISKYLWSILDPYKRSSFVGIKGIDEIGLNSVIENWIYINKKLDEEEDYNRLLEMTLLIVGASNYKAARTLSRNHENHQRELKELRDEIFKYGCNKNREIKNNEKREEWTPPLLTREDLVKELYRQASGYKDKHDLFIEEWIQKQREKVNEVKKSVEEKQKEYINKIKMEEDKIEFSRPASKEDIDKIKLNMKKIGNRVIR